MSQNFLHIQKEYLQQVWARQLVELEAALPARHRGNYLYFQAFGEPCELHPQEIILGGETLTGPEGILIAMYASYVPNEKLQLLPLKSFKELPESMPYQGAFSANAEQILLPHVPAIRNHQQGLAARFSGHVNPDAPSGDFSFTLYPLPRIPLYYIFYRKYVLYARAIFRFGRSLLRRGGLSADRRFQLKLLNRKNPWVLRAISVCLAKLRTYTQGHVRGAGSRRQDLFYDLAVSAEHFLQGIRHLVYAFGTAIAPLWYLYRQNHLVCFLRCVFRRPIKCIPWFFFFLFLFLVVFFNFFVSSPCYSKSLSGIGPDLLYDLRPTINFTDKIHRLHKIYLAELGDAYVIYGKFWTLLIITVFLVMTLFVRSLQLCLMEKKMSYVRNQTGGSYVKKLSALRVYD